MLDLWISSERQINLNQRKSLTYVDIFQPFVVRLLAFWTCFIIIKFILSSF